MQKKTKNWLIISAVSVGIAAIIVGSVIGVKAANHHESDATPPIVNSNNVASSANSNNNVASNSLNHDSLNNNKTLLPTLYSKQNDAYALVDNNEVTNETNNEYYLSPNLSSTNNETITFTWYGTNKNLNYGGTKLGQTSSQNNHGYFQLTNSVLDKYHYYYYAAQINENGTLINSKTSNDLEVTINNPITVKSLSVNLNGTQITSIASDYLLTNSDAFDLVANALLPNKATNITYQWYASTVGGTNLNQLLDANDVIDLGTTSSNTFALNQSVIKAKFINFFVKVSATINNQSYFQVAQTNFAYNDTSEISTVNLSLTPNQVYVGQQDNYGTITLTYTVNSNLEGKAYRVEFYGEDPYANGSIINAINPIGKLAGTTSTASPSGTLTFQLSADNAFYSKYYAVISIANYSSTTNTVSQTITQPYNSSNNIPSVSHNDNSTHDVTIAPMKANNVSQVGDTNTYDVMVGTSLTLQPVHSMLYDNASASYQWQESTNGKTWTDLSSTSNNLVISSIGGNITYYRVIVKTGNMTTTSDVIKIVPVATSTITAQIYGTNLTSNLLNVYSQDNAQQTLHLDLKSGVTALSLSDLNDVKISWYVNNQLVSANNSLSFTNTYQPGVNTISVQVSFELGNKEYSTNSTIANIQVDDFTINYFNLNITSDATSTVNYNTNANNFTVAKSSSFYMYSNATYQWQYSTNNQSSWTTLSTNYSSLPTKLPNYFIDSNVSFRLIATNSSYQSLFSNTISFSVNPSSMQFSAKLTNANGTTSQTIYDKNNQVTLDLTLLENGTSFNSYNSLNGTITWEIKDSTNNTYVPINADTSLPINASASRSLIIPSSLIKNFGNYDFEAVLTLNGISQSITSNQFVLTYASINASLNVTSSTANALSSTNTTGVYNANYGCELTFKVANANFDLNNATYSWQVNGKTVSNNDTSSFTISKLMATTSQTIKVTITADNQSPITQSVTIIPHFDVSEFTTAISSTTQNGGTIISTSNVANHAQTIKEFNVTANNLSFNVYYDNNPFTIVSPTVTWNGVSGDQTSTQDVKMGANSINVTATIMLNGKSVNLPSIQLTIDNAKLMIAPVNSNVVYGQTTTIDITSNSQQSLNEVFGNNANPTYAWTANNQSVNDTTNSYTPSAIDSNTTYGLTVTYNKYSLTANADVTVASLPTLHPSIVCTNSDGQSQTSPLELESNNLDTYSFDFNLNTNYMIVGSNVTYTLNDDNNNITLPNSSVVYNAGNNTFKINFSDLANFNPGTYTLTASMEVNNLNGQVPYTATFKINYNQVSILVNGSKVTNGMYQYTAGNTLPTLSINNQIYNQVNNSSATYSYQWEIYENGSWSPISTNATYQLTANDLDGVYSYKVIVTSDGLTIPSNPIQIQPILPTNEHVMITDANGASPLSIYNASNDTQPLSIEIPNVDSSQITNEQISWENNGSPISGNIDNYQFSIGQNQVSATVTFDYGGKSYTLTSSSNFVINYYALTITTSSSLNVNYNTNANTISISKGSSFYMYDHASYQWEYLVNGSSTWQTLGSASSQFPSTIPSYFIDQNVQFKLVAYATGYQTLSSNAISITVNPTSMNFTGSLVNTNGATSQTIYSPNTAVSLSLDMQQNGMAFSNYQNMNGTITWSYRYGNGKVWSTIQNETSLALSQSSARNLTIPSDLINNIGVYQFQALITLNGISQPISTSYFTLVYVQKDSLISVTSSTNNEVSSSSTNGVYNAYYGGQFTIAINSNTFSLTNATYSWEVNNNEDSSLTNNSLTINQFNEIATQTYQITIDIPNLPQIVQQVSINPIFNQSDFSASITSATPTTGTIVSTSNVSNGNETIKEFNVSQNNLTYNVFYNNKAFTIINPTVSWNGANGNRTMTEQVTMGTNNFPITASIIINNQTITLPSLQLTIYNAKLMIAPTHSSVAYGQTTTINITPDSQTSLNDVFDTITPTYTWSANGNKVNGTNVSYQTNAIDANTTYGLTVSYGNYSLSANTTVDVTKLPTLYPSIDCMNGDGQSVTSPLELESNSLTTYSFNFNLNTNLMISGSDVTYTLTNDNTTITLPSSSVTYNNGTNTFSIDFGTLSNFIPGSYTLTASMTVNDLNGPNSYTASFTINYNATTILVNGEQVTDGVYQYQAGNNNPTLSTDNQIYNDTNSSDYTYQWEIYEDSAWTTISTNPTYTLTTTDLSSENSYRVIVTSGNVVVTSPVIKVQPGLPASYDITIRDLKGQSPVSVYAASDARQILIIHIPPALATQMTNEVVTWQDNGQVMTSGVKEVVLNDAMLAVNPNKISFITVPVGHNVLTVSISFTYNGQNYTETSNAIIVNYYALNITSSTSSTLQFNTNANSINIKQGSPSYVYKNASYQWKYQLNNSGTWQNLGNPTNQFPTSIPSYFIDQDVQFELVASANGYQTLTSNILSFNVNTDSTSFTSSIVNSNNNSSQTIYNNTTSVSLSLSMQQNDMPFTNYDSLGGTITWEISDSANNNTWTAISGESDLPIAAASSRTLIIPSILLTSYGTYQIQAVINLTGISGTIQTNPFTLTYEEVSASLTVSSNTSNEVSQVGSTNVYDANYGSQITIAITHANFAANEATYDWTLNGQPDSYITSSSFTINNFEATTSQVYQVTIQVKNQTPIVLSVTINPVFNTTWFSTSISSASPTTGTIVNTSSVNNGLETIKEFNVNQNNLTLNVDYNGQPFTLVNPTVSWNGNPGSQTYTQDVSMGTTSLTITASIMLNGKSVTLPSIQLTIYNAKLVISAASNSVMYGQTTTISISNASQQSLMNVFGTTSPVYSWTANSKNVSNNTDSYTPSAIDTNTTYQLTATYGNYSLSANTSVTVTSLPTFSATLNCTNSNNQSQTSPLELVSNNLGTYSFNFNLNTKYMITGSDVSYTLTDGSTMINLSTSSVSYDNGSNTLSIDFASLPNFMPGAYTLTATMEVNNLNGQVPYSASFKINYNKVSILVNGSEVSNGIYKYTAGNTLPTLSIKNQIYNQVHTTNPTYTYQWEIYQNGKWSVISQSATYQLTNRDLDGAYSYQVVVNSNGLLVAATPIQIQPILPNTEQVMITDANGASPLSIYNASNEIQPLSIEIPNTLSSQISNEQISWKNNGVTITTPIDSYLFPVGQNKVSATVTFDYGGQQYTLSTTSDFVIDYYALNINPSSSLAVNYNTNANQIAISQSSNNYVYANASYQWEYLTNSSSTWQVLGNPTSKFPTALPSYLIDQNIQFRLVASATGYQTLNSNILNVTVNPKSMDFTGSLVNSNNQTSQTIANNNPNVTLSLDMKQAGNPFTNYENLTGMITWQYKYGNATSWTSIANESSLPISESSSRTLSIPNSLITNAGTYEFSAVISLNGISHPITTQTFTLAYGQINATLDVTSSMANEVNETSTAGVYDAYFGGPITISVNSLNFDLSNATFTWRINGTVASNYTSNSIIISEFDATTKQTYQVTIQADNQPSQTKTITIIPQFNNSEFTAKISATTPSGSIISTQSSMSGNNVNEVIKEYDVSANDLTYDLFYGNKQFAVLIPTISWNGVSGSENSAQPVNMGTNSFTVTSSIVLNGKTVNLPTINLTIYNAKLVITTPSSMVNYGQSATLNITNASQQSLNEVFGTNSTPTYVWTANSNNLSTNEGTLTTSPLIEKTTYTLTETYQINNKSYSIASDSLTINVNSLQSENVQATISCDGNSSLALAASNYDKTYDFDLSYAPSNGQVIPASALSGNVTYSITSSSGNSVISATSTNVNQLAIDLSALNSPGVYTLSANITLNDPDYSSYSIATSYTITYNQVTIDASTGNLTNGVLSINENTANLTLTANTNDVYNGTSYTYQWYTVDANGSLNEIKGAQSKTYQIANINANEVTYEVIVTSNNFQIASSPLTINPQLSATPSVVISGNKNIYHNFTNPNSNDNVVSATIYNGTTVLTPSDYDHLTVTWTVNGEVVTNAANDLSLNASDLQLGQNTIKVSVSFMVGSNDYGTNANPLTATYTVTYYELDLNASSNTVAYNTNADNISITQATNSYLYNNPTYQWQQWNGSSWSNVSSNVMYAIPDSLPNEILYSAAKFRLVVNASGYQQAIYSNPIDVTVTNPDLTGVITSPGVTGNTDVVYGNSNQIDLTFQINQNSTTFNTPSNTAYSWNYTTPAGNTVTVSNNNTNTWNNFANQLTSAGTYTITATATLPANITVSAQFIVKYTPIEITGTPAYYGYNVTLSTNIVGAQSYAWYDVSEGSVTGLAVSNDATYTIDTITSSQQYQLWVTSNNGQTYVSNTYTINVNKLADLSLSTSYNESGYAAWMMQEQLNTWIGSASWNDFVTQYTNGYQLMGATYSDFTNYKCYFSSMPSADGFGNHQFMTISATSTSPINVGVWDQSQGAFENDTSLQVPSGYVFTWTLPVELSQMYVQDGTVYLPWLNASDYLNSQYQPSLATPFGLSIGTMSNPTALSGNGQYSQAKNGVFAISYGHSNGSPYNPPASGSFSNAYTGTNSSSVVLTNTNNSVNINHTQLITFLTTASTNGGVVNTTNFNAAQDSSIPSPSCTYTISIGKNVLVSGNASMIGDEAMVNYEFNHPGQYQITITYTLPNASNNPLTASQTYYVNYNQVAINTSNSNPLIGSSVTLSANNSGMYAPTTNANYQWYQIINGAPSIIQSATTSTYQVDLDNYESTYQYELKETINGITYTSAIMTLTPNLSEFKVSANITNSAAINDEIGTTSATLASPFNLSITCNGVTYNANNPLSTVKIVWEINGVADSSYNNEWSISYSPTQYGTYTIKAIVTVSLYAKTFNPVSSNPITLNYVSQIGTLSVTSATNSSPYVYNRTTSKLAIWGNGSNSPDNTQITFNVTGLTYNASDQYEVEFAGNNNVTTYDITNFSSSNGVGTFSLPVSDFNGYTSLAFFINNEPASQKIVYTYLPQKPGFIIKQNTSIIAQNPQITLEPNETFGNADFGSITATNISLTFDVNGETITITSTGSFTDGMSDAKVSIFGMNEPFAGFYKVTNENGNYVITFNATKFNQLMNWVNYGGYWTTINVSVSLNNITLDQEPFAISDPEPTALGYANTSSSTNDMYTAGIYRNNVAVSSVPVGATGVTLQVSGVPSNASIQWIQVTSAGDVDLTNGNTATYSLNPYNFSSSGEQLIYEAQITTASGTVTTNECTVSVVSLGQASINILDNSTGQPVIAGTNGYSLTANQTYDIQTTNQTGVVLNNPNQTGSTSTYYQWQYKSNSIILGANASNCTWTNIGNASSSYSPYQYDAIALYPVSFRLVVFTSDNDNANISFNAQTDSQYIISNVISTIAPLNSTFSLSTSSNSIEQGQSATYTLNPSNQSEIIDLIKHAQYQVDVYDSTSKSYQNITYYPMNVTWYYKESNASSWTQATSSALAVTVNNNHLEFVGAQSLSYKFASSCFSSNGTYDIYAKISFIDNNNTYSTPTYSLTINTKQSANSLNYNYQTYMQDAIANWANSNEGVENTTLTGYQSQVIQGTTAYTTFTDLIRQNMQGLEILDGYQDFGNIQVSFTQMPSADSSELGNSKWLTITATSTSTIGLTSWNNGSWGTSPTVNVKPGYLFTWTLPYSASSIQESSTANGNILEMAVNNTYGNSNNESLPVPFGLSVGTKTNPTVVSATWGSDATLYDGRLCTNYDTGDESFALPSEWVVPYNKNQAFINLFANGLITNSANFGTSNTNAQTLISNMIDGNMAGFRFPTASYQDFNNWYVSWDPTQVNGYTVLQLSAFSNTNLSVDYWDNSQGSWELMSNYTIPSGSYFTWTLPYAQSDLSLNANNATLSNSAIAYSSYFNDNTGAPTWNIPLGVSVGSSMSNPISITSSATFTTTYNNATYGTNTSHSGIIGIGYSDATTLSFTYPGQPTTSTNVVLPNPKK